MSKHLLVLLGLSLFMVDVSCAPKPSPEVRARYDQLPPVSKKLWDLTASLPFDDVMAYAASDTDKEWPSWTYFVKAFFTTIPILHGMTQIDSFFQHPPEEFAAEPEYWYHAWLYWQMTPEALTFPPDEEKDKAVAKRLREESRKRCEQYAPSYAPAGFALALDSMQSADWPAMSRYLDLLEALEPGNGLYHFLEATAVAEQGKLNTALEEVSRAAEARRVSFPLDSFSQAVHELWLENKQPVSNSLIMEYGMRPGLDEKCVSELFARFAKEMDDVEFMKELSMFRHAIVKFARADYGYGADQAELVAQLLGILNDRAGEAYARAHSVEGINAVQQVRSHIAEMREATNYESGWADAINELLKERRKTHWAKLLPFRDFARLRILGLADKIQFSLRRVETASYPPLRGVNKGSGRL